jgi:hypothetical protein
MKSTKRIIYNDTAFPLEPASLNSDYQEMPNNIKASPGSVYEDSIQQSKKAATNRISDVDGVIENDGHEDEALMDDELVYVSEGSRTGTDPVHSDTRLFDSLDVGDSDEIVGTTYEPS